MATVTGSGLVAAIQSSTGVTLNAVLNATLTAKLQQLIDTGTYSALSAAVAIQAFSTDIKAVVDGNGGTGEFVTHVTAVFNAITAGTTPPDFGTPAVTFTLAASPATVNEGVAVTYTLKASALVDVDTEVTFAVLTGNDTVADQGTSSTNSNDFSEGALNPVTVVMAAGTDTAIFVVRARSDSMSESPEAYTVTAKIGSATVASKVATVQDGSLPSTDGKTFMLTEGTAAGADVMKLVGDQVVRIDFTANDNQVKGLDLDGDGTIENNGVENNNPTALDNGKDFEIVDAYRRDLFDENNIAQNYLGNIAYDGTGFAGDGVNTDGNIFLGGLGADIALGGIGNDFFAGGGVAQTNPFSDRLDGGRNADFFFAELSLLDNTDGNNLTVNGGSTSDDAAVGNNTPQDSDWLLIEASDDEDGTIISLVDDFLSVTTGAGQSMGGTEIENVDASGNLYGFLDDVNVAIGGAGKVVNGENVAIGASAQLAIFGSLANNILIGGYDNDLILGAEGNDLLMGGNLKYAVNNVNAAGIINDGRDELIGGDGNDNLVWEADGGIYEGQNEQDEPTADVYENDDGTVGTSVDTLWLTSQSMGTGTAAALTTDGVIRLDLATGGGSGFAGGVDASAGYGGADADAAESSSIYAGVSTADQSNYVTGVNRTQVQDVENVIATGLGAVDYKAAGTNDPELNFNNQQNHLGYQGDLDLRGTDGNNTLYANTGDDIVEGRQDNDLLSGGGGNDDFIFNLGVSFEPDRLVPMDFSAAAGADGVFGFNPETGIKDDQFVLFIDSGEDEGVFDTGDEFFAFDTGPNSGAFIEGDGVDVIHRQKDANNDNIWDTGFGRDFGLESASTLSDSTFTLGLPTTLAPYVDGVKFELAGTTYTLSGLTAPNFAAWLVNLQTAIDAKVGLETVTASSSADGVAVLTDSAGGTFVELTTGAWLLTTGSLPSDGLDAWFQEVGAPAEDIVQDRLLYVAYEDRADAERVDDDSFNGSTISLGIDNYAEDLVISFAADGTRIAEDQQYGVTFKNLTTQDKVVLTVNGVNYALQVGLDLDGNIIAAEDGVGDAQDDIQAAFLARFEEFINTFMDDDTSVGAVDATLVGSTIFLTQRAYNGEETVFMTKPTVAIDNLSRGEPATATVANLAEHEVHLLDFDGRNNELNETNVLFLGNMDITRSELTTALTAGSNGTSAIVGFEAKLIDSGANNLEATVRTTGEEIANNIATNAPLAGTDYSVHGDDFLLGGAGSDKIDGGTGDDRVMGSLGTDDLDGGKNFYAVKVLGEAESRVYTLNVWEAANIKTFIPALVGLTLSSVTLLNQSEDGVAAASGLFDDTLVYQQADFTAGVTEFTITLDDYNVTSAGVVELRNGGAGMVQVDVDGDGDFEATADFTNFENIRTVSGTGNAVADSGQGNDTLNVSALSTATDGISYDLTNGGNAGDVTYSVNEAINGLAYKAGQTAAALAGATAASVKAAILALNTTEAFDAAVNELTVTGTAAAYLAKVAALPLLTRPTSFTDNMTGTDGVTDYESLVMKVDGVENVIAGLGDDLLVIDETEAAKDNSFSASLGTDRIEYQNNFASTLGNAITAEPIVTIIVNGTDIDTVNMTSGRLGTVSANDTLSSVEYITLLSNTAEGSSEADVIDVTGMTAGAVVDYTNGEVRSPAGVVQVTIEGIARMENVYADGDDLVIVADADGMSALNARSDDAADDAVLDGPDLPLMTYLDYDTIDADTLVRVDFSAQDTDDIHNAINFAQYTFDLSRVGTEADVDRVDYHNANDQIVAAVNLDPANDVDYVLVNASSAADDSFAETDDRVDALISVEEIVASQGESVLDLTEAETNLNIRYSKVLDGTDRTDIDSTETLITIENADTSVPYTNRAYVELYDNDTLNDATGVTALWNRIEGSDADEYIELTADQGPAIHTFNLRGGDNEVNYNELQSTGIELSIQAIGTGDDGFTSVNIQSKDNAGVIQNGGDNGAGGGTAGNGVVDGDEVWTDYDRITSYNGLNETSVGALRIEASQSEDDSINLESVTDNNLIILGQTEGLDDLVSIALAGGNELVNLVLTGFETLIDGSGDDTYTIDDLTNFVNTLTLVDTVGDFDTLKLTDGALENYTGVGDADWSDASIELTDMEATIDFPVGFDFQALDISEVTEQIDYVVGTDEVLVLGSLSNFGDLSDAEVEVQGFQTIEFTSTTGMGSDVVIDMDLGEFRQNDGTVLFEFDSATTFDFSAITTALTVSVVDEGAAGVTVIGGSAIDEITGGAGADTITGGAGADVLDGGIIAAVGAKLVQSLNPATFVPGTEAGSGHVFNLSDVTTNLFADPTPEIADAFDYLEGADIDVIGATWANLDLATWVTAFDNSGLTALEAGSLTSVTYDSGLNELSFQFANNAAGSTITDADLLAASLIGDFGDATLTGGESATAFVAAVHSSDTFVYGVVGESTFAAMDVISNFTVGAGGDILDFRGLPPADDHSPWQFWDVGVAADFDALVDLVQVEMADDNFPVVGMVGTNTYVFVDHDHNDSWEVATDTVIQLAGVNSADLIAANMLHS